MAQRRMALAHRSALAEVRPPAHNHQNRGATAANSRVHATAHFGSSAAAAANLAHLQQQQQQSTKSMPAILSRKRKSEEFATRKSNMDFSDFLTASSSMSKMRVDAYIIEDEDEEVEEEAGTASGSGDSQDENEDDECMIVCEENMPPSSLALQQQQPPQRHLQPASASLHNSSLPSSSSSSSRIPLSTLSSNGRRSAESRLAPVNLPSESNVLAPSRSGNSNSSSSNSSIPKSKAGARTAASTSRSPPASKIAALSSRMMVTTTPPAAKRLKLREAWSNFRSHIHTVQTHPVSRSPAPFPTLKWADRQKVWDLICQKETGMYRRLSGDDLLARHASIQPRMRAILLDWLVEVCEVYRLHRETFYLAVDFIDRYLSNTEDMPKTRLQLVGVTCLFIASKIEEIYPPKLSEFAYVTDGACSEDEITTMELVVMKQLNWGLSPMTPNAWAKLYMQASHCDMTPHNEVFVTPQFFGEPFIRLMQLLDLCIMDMDSLSFPYSVLAASAFYHVQQDQQVTCNVSGYAWDQLAPCVLWMSAFAQVTREVQPKMVQQQKNGGCGRDPFGALHNVQMHAVDMKLLDEAQQRVEEVRQEQQLLAEAAAAAEEQRRRSASPDLEQLQLQQLRAGGSGVDLTPPDDPNDVQFRPHHHHADLLQTPTSSKRAAAPGMTATRVPFTMLSPVSPGAEENRHQRQMTH